MNFGFYELSLFAISSTIPRFLVHNVCVACVYIHIQYVPFTYSHSSYVIDKSCISLADFVCSYIIDIREMVSVFCSLYAIN